MSVKNFIPAMWSARLLANLQASHVYAHVLNHDYEGDIKAMGDRVKINSIGNVTIAKYTGEDIHPAEDLLGSAKELVIDQANYFNFQVDDIDQAQTSPRVMDAGMAQAGHDLSDAFDREIAKTYVDAGHTMGSDATPLVLTKDNIYDTIVDAGVKLDEGNASKTDRFIVVPAFVHGLLQKSSAFVSANNEIVQNGYVGKVAGFSVYVSNNVPHKDGKAYKMIAGTKQAIAVAEQILEVEAYRPELRFSDAVKGLHVFGLKVIQPKALVALTINKG